MTDPAWIDELERLEKAATPGPWMVIPQTTGDQLIAHLKDPSGRAMRIVGVVYSRVASVDMDAANARLIAAAPALLAEVRALRAEVEALRGKAAETYSPGFGPQKGDNE